MHKYLGYCLDNKVIDPFSKTRLRTPRRITSVTVSVELSSCCCYSLPEVSDLAWI